jgi:hypothetical protein
MNCRRFNPSPWFSRRVLCLIREKAFVGLRPSFSTHVRFGRTRGTRPVLIWFCYAFTHCPGRVLGIFPAVPSRLYRVLTSTQDCVPKALTCLGCFSLEPPQKRHPERSASSDSSRETALDGAESKDPEDAYLAHAARSFSATEARRQDLAAVPT